MRVAGRTIIPYILMPEFCDVALPVPLDMVFTYRLADGIPIVGGRGLVPFRKERLSGVVEALHASAIAGSSRRSHQDIDTQIVDYTVLHYLSLSVYPLEAPSR